MSVLRVRTVRAATLLLAVAAVGCGVRPPAAVAPADPPAIAQAASGHEMMSSSDPAPLAVAAEPTAPHKPVDARLPAVIEGQRKKITIVGSEETFEVAPGVKVAGWTLGGTVPGPILHIREGDVVDSTFINKLPSPHTLDYHAARTPWNVNFRDIVTGDTLKFSWIAEYPGVFMYHCVTDPPVHHVAQGMYGVMIIDPKDGYQDKADREYVLVQSEFYLRDQGNGLMTTDYPQAQNEAPDYVVFNGYYKQYIEHPLQAKVGERVRFYIENVGPNHVSAFHFVGGIIDKAYVEGNPKNVLYGLQTIGIPQSGGVVVDAVFSEPGQYPFVTHLFADESKGAAGILEVTP